MAINYVKFYRGSPLAFENAIKNSDTLYFISESDSTKGKLYLGNKLISGDVGSLTELEDIILTNIGDKHLLVYNATSNKWENKTIDQVIGQMIGATETEQGSTGLVPPPGIGQQNLFLRGDGTWAAPEGNDTSVVDADNISIETVDGIVQVKNFGKSYFAYVPAVKDDEGNVTTPASYVETEGFIAGLEAKVTKRQAEDNSEYYELTWYEPNPENAEDLSALVAALGRDVQELENNTYTKTQVNNLIASAEHLKRIIVNSTDDIDIGAPGAEQYIYMVPTQESDSPNKYIEYMVIEGALESVGSWEVNLDDYVKKEDGKSLVSDSEIEKLATIEEGAQKNYITSVSEDFEVNDGRLNLISIPSTLDLTKNKSFSYLSSKVTNLQDSLENNYVLKNLYRAEVGNLDNLLRASGNSNSTLVDEINFINERLEWKELG